MLGDSGSSFGVSESFLVGDSTIVPNKEPHSSLQVGLRLSIWGSSSMYNCPSEASLSFASYTA